MYVKRVDDAGLRMAIQAAGTRYRLAKLLGLTHVSVLQWARVPVGRVLQVEQVTGVPREKLRPELYRQVKVAGARR
jgi:DNA-binding transcriptional regulator YdaS (Cro superfamily)